MNLGLLGSIALNMSYQIWVLAVTEGGIWRLAYFTSGISRSAQSNEFLKSKDCSMPVTDRVRPAIIVPHSDTPCTCHELR